MITYHDQNQLLRGRIYSNAWFQADTLGEGRNLQSQTYNTEEKLEIGRDYVLSKSIFPPARLQLLNLPCIAPPIENQASQCLSLCVTFLIQITTTTKCSVNGALSIYCLCLFIDCSLSQQAFTQCLLIHFTLLS